MSVIKILFKKFVIFRLNILIIILNAHSISESTLPNVLIVTCFNFVGWKEAIKQIKPCELRKAFMIILLRLIW